MALKPHRLFLVPEGITREVAGQKIVFFPVSVNALLQLQALARPLASALNVLFSDTSGDAKQERKTFVQRPATTERPAKDAQPLDPIEEHTSTSIDAVSTDLVKFRATQREAAIDRLITALSQEESQVAIGKLLMSSMRNDFPSDPSAEDAREFMAQLPLPHLKECVFGLLEANKGVLGPLAGRLSPMLAGVAPLAGSERSATPSQEPAQTPSG